MHQLRLINRCFGIQSIFVKVAFLVKLLVDVGGLQEIVFDEALGGCRMLVVAERIGDAEVGWVLPFSKRALEKLIVALSSWWLLHVRRWNSAFIGSRGSHGCRHDSPLIVLLEN